MTTRDGRRPGLGSPFLDAPLLADAAGAGRNLWPMRIETPYLGASIGTAGAAGPTRELVDEPSPRGEATPEEASPDPAELRDEVDEIDESDARGEVDEADEAAARHQVPRRSRWRVPDGLVPDDAGEVLEHQGSAVDEALASGDWAGALQAAIEGGERDENKLTNLVFFARHKDLDPTTPLDTKTKAGRALALEWTKIRNKEVWAAIQRSAEDTVLAVHGKDVASGDRLFWGSKGTRFKERVLWAAKEVDLDPGLIAAALVAEIGEIDTYLSSSKVYSYYIGVDDFYAMRQTLADKVPAYAKVGWDRKQTPLVHLNDAQSHPREVKTIEFDSGRDALLATAVYLKYAEVRLREDAIKAGGDFDKLPIETRFALIRMSMAAGRAGAEKRLLPALNGKDILVRNYKPTKAYHTDRNATIRAAQALHLSDWMFGTKHAVAQPELGVADELDEEVEEVAELEDEVDAAVDFLGGTRDDADEIEAGEVQEYEDKPPARYRTVFYDRDELRCIDGWTRATPPSAVYLIDRATYQDIRADAAKRGRQFNQFVQQALALTAQRRPVNLQAPVFVKDPAFATVPLNPANPRDWDDLMIEKLVAAGKRLKIESVTDQWKSINSLFDKAKADARAAASANREALEFVAYFVLDVINATLTMVAASNVTMENGHAKIPINRIRGTRKLVIPGGDAAARVIGDIHTHYLLDPLIDLNSTAQGSKITFSHRELVNGVSDVDVNAARDQQMVVYAVDSKYLHRANPDGTRQDKLLRSGNVLREALRVFGREAP